MIRRMSWTATVAALYLLTWYGLDLASQQFTSSPEVTLWNPAVGLDFVLVLVFGLRWWPLLVVSRVLHPLVVPTLPALPLLVYVTVPAGVVVAAGWLLLRSLRADPRLPALRDVALFVAVAVLGAPLVMAAVQVLNLTAFGLLPPARGGGQLLELWAGMATGVGLLAPPLLLLLGRWPTLWSPPPASAGLAASNPAETRPAAPTWRRVLEALAAAGLIGAALWTGYGAPRGPTLDYSYALFVPLLYVAVRYGFVPAAVTVLALNVGAALLVGGQVNRGGGLALQFGLLTLTVSGLLLGAVVRERQHLTARLRYLALHDPLTRLGNRRLFGERIRVALAGSPPPGSLAVLLLDFDNFKGINDTLGHAAGDQVLTVVAGRLSAAVRPGDTVVRLGGDEFAVILPALTDPRQATEIAERLRQALLPTLPVHDFDLRIRASLGVALWDAHQDGETLLRHADLALYHAKAHRRGHVQVFDAGLHRATLDRLELETELRATLMAGGLEVYYQPLAELVGGQLRGFEALARWPHPTRGLLLPDTFIPLAEDTGLIIALDRWMLRAAVREAASWPTPAGERPLSVGVNLSAAHAHLQETVEVVRGALLDTGLDPSRLMLELTENVLLSDTPAVVGTLQALRDLGVRLALDDFGSGYSSLNYLRHFPVSDLKVDRSFFTDLDHPVSTELARSVASLGRALGLNTVAEGVQSARHYARVRALGYVLGQGEYISPPLPVAQARELVRRRPTLVRDDAPP